MFKNLRRRSASRSCESQVVPWVSCERFSAISNGVPRILMEELHWFLLDRVCISERPDSVCLLSGCCDSRWPSLEIPVRNSLTILSDRSSGNLWSTNPGIEFIKCAHSACRWMEIISVGNWLFRSEEIRKNLKDFDALKKTSRNVVQRLGAIDDRSMVFLSVNLVDTDARSTDFDR